MLEWCSCHIRREARPLSYETRHDHRPARQTPPHPDRPGGAIGGVGLRHARLVQAGTVIFAVQKRVVVEHLLDFLAQLQCGELQQADGLLQLRRQSQMLGDAKRQALLHFNRPITFGNARRGRPGARLRCSRFQKACPAPAHCRR